MVIHKGTKVTEDHSLTQHSHNTENDVKRRKIWKKYENIELDLIIRNIRVNWNEIIKIENQITDYAMKIAELRTRDALATDTKHNLNRRRRQRNEAAVAAAVFV